MPIIKGPTAMSNEPTVADELRRLAGEADVAAETTVEPNRKRALRDLALKYQRLSDLHAWTMALKKAKVAPSS
jgi:hypothetical protein